MKKQDLGLVFFIDYFIQIVYTQSMTNLEKTYQDILKECKPYLNQGKNPPKEMMAQAKEIRKRIVAQNPKLDILLANPFKSIPTDKPTSLPSDTDLLGR